MLEIKNISKTFNRGTANEKVVLDRLSLYAKDGDFISIIGSNGTGKSTLFNAIAGSFSIDSGKIILDGDDLTHKKEYICARKIGRLFQDPLKGTAPNMTIEENLRLAHMRHVKGKINRDFYREKLAELDMGLEDRMKTKVGLLSGGQRQAITLLMATISNPHLLLLDEHTAALDPSTAEKVLALTKKIISENKITALMITHNINSALTLGNRTIMLDEGRVLLDIVGQEREEMTVARIMEIFREKSAKELDNDRILLAR